MADHEPPPDEATPAGRIDVRDPLREELRDPSFPAAVRGYDRRAVDAYVQQINRVIAELQVAGSPAAAVRHALDRVGEQTSGILQRARETAEEITTTARQEAEDTTDRAKAEAQEIISAAQRQAAETIAEARARADEIQARASEQAEARTRQAEEDIAALRADAEADLRSLQAEIAAVSDERRRVVEDVRRMAARLEAAIAEIAEEAPTPEPDSDESAAERPEAPRLDSS